MDSVRERQILTTFKHYLNEKGLERLDELDVHYKEIWK